MWTTFRAFPASFAPARRLAAAVALLSAGLAACSDGAGSPTSPTPQTRTYDLSLLVASVRVAGDCENADGNPGEWTWKVDVRRPGGGSVVASTDSYPSPTGAVSWSEDNSGLYTINRTVTIRTIPEANIRDVTITLSATEWDGNDRDPDMNDRSETNRVGFSLTGVNQSIGMGVPGCGVSFTYRATFVEN